MKQQQQGEKKETSKPIPHKCGKYSTNTYFF